MHIFSSGGSRPDAKAGREKELNHKGHEGHQVLLKQLPKFCSFFAIFVYFASSRLGVRFFGDGQGRSMLPGIPEHPHITLNLAIT